ncbi:quinone-dependent dihydroorotate dehydrogenase [Paenibacillus thermotolerans]|uniref:quinone-dependent dihydroorotate dehydrogenase n=1 Tax=Paenibacillus thermotolerans TaxID=3027807 RepID=UPI0023681567|nr:MULTISPECIES: quinone-dependent dihydroorotate dehydrogenase [unclassified Paenibacillus]
MLYTKIAKPLLFKLDPERAHHLTVGGLSRAARIPGALAALRAIYRAPEASPELESTLCGLRFPHPIGLSAGLDKNGSAADGFAAIGFGFVEVGTVTPKAQPGNDTPRLFRLPPDQALINRMGFNNVGAEAMARNLAHTNLSVPLLINIGKNKTTPNELAHEDYTANLRILYDRGDAFVVNVSSPNTPGLRSLQHGEEMRRLLEAVVEERAVQAQRHEQGPKLKPIFVKIAPDLTPEELQGTVEAVMAAGVDGIIATNTTLSREGLTHANRSESGGLSGKPLKERSTAIIRDVYRLTDGKLPIIGSGGIFTADDAYEKIRAGASLVQVYTALVYEGPGLVRTLADGLRNRLKADGFKHLSEAVGRDA